MFVRLTVLSEKDMVSHTSNSITSEMEIEKTITKKIRRVKNVNTTNTLSVISEQENL